MRELDPFVHMNDHFALFRSNIEKIYSNIGASKVFVDAINKPSGILITQLTDGFDYESLTVIIYHFLAPKSVNKLCTYFCDLGGNKLLKSKKCKINEKFGTIIFFLFHNLGTLP